MKKFKEKYTIFCNKVKLYLCELKKKDIKFSDIFKFLFKILTLIFLFCVLATTIFKSCSNCNQNHIEPKKQLKSEVLSIDNLNLTIDIEIRNHSDSYTVSFTNKSALSTEMYLAIIVSNGNSNLPYLDLSIFGANVVVNVDKFSTTGGNNQIMCSLSSTDYIFTSVEKKRSINWVSRGSFNVFLNLDTNVVFHGSISKLNDFVAENAPWCYDGKRNGIYKFCDIAFTKQSIRTLFFDFSSYGGNFNRLFVNKGVLSYANDSEVYQVALLNEDTNKWEFTHQEDKYINLRHFQNENDYIQFDLQLIKTNILENISFEEFQKETAKTAFDAGVDLTQTTNNSIVLFFTQLFQLPYMIFTTLFAPFTFELGGISINLGSTLLGLMLVLLIVWVMKKFK